MQPSRLAASSISPSVASSQLDHSKNVKGREVGSRSPAPGAWRTAAVDRMQDKTHEHKAHRSSSALSVAAFAIFFSHRSYVVACMGAAPMERPWAAIVHEVVHRLTSRLNQPKCHTVEMLPRPHPHRGTVQLSHPKKFKGREGHSRSLAPRAWSTAAVGCMHNKAHEDKAHRSCSALRFAAFAIFLSNRFYVLASSCAGVLARRWAANVCTCDTVRISGTRNERFVQKAQPSFGWTSRPPCSTDPPHSKPRTAKMLLFGAWWVGVCVAISQSCPGLPICNLPH